MALHLMWLICPNTLWKSLIHRSYLPGSTSVWQDHFLHPRLSKECFLYQCEKVHTNPFLDLDYIAVTEGSGFKRKIDQIRYSSNIKEHKTSRS